MEMSSKAILKVTIPDWSASVPLALQSGVTSVKIKFAVRWLLLCYCQLIVTAFIEFGYIRRYSKASQGQSVLGIPPL